MDDQKGRTAQEQELRELNKLILDCADLLVENGIAQSLEHGIFLIEVMRISKGLVVPNKQERKH